MRKQRNNSKRICFICKDESQCPLLKGVFCNQVNEIYDSIYSNINPEITTLVDTSKKPFWAKRFINNSKYEYRFIHLIRDPRPYIRRMLLRYNTMGERLFIRKQMVRDFIQYTPQFLFGTDNQVYTYRWLLQNLNITKFLRENNLHYNLVTYYDLANNTSTELQRLTESIGLIYEPDQIEYWNFEHHGTQKIEYQWIKKQKMTNYFDQRWKEFLSPDINKRIMSNHHINAYLQDIGVLFHKDGLSLPKKKNL